MNTFVPFFCKRFSLIPCTLGMCLLALLLGGPAGCGTTAYVKLSSVQQGSVLELNPTLLAYRYSDKNTADVYMTDLPREVLDSHADLTGVSGQLTHIHLFVAPEAGKTPIDDTACSVSIRNIVIAQGQVGVYGGGGFFYPYRRPGREYLKGNIAGATLRLIRATPGFGDKLGAAEFEGAVNAPLDEPMAGALAERLRSLLEMSTPIVHEEPAPPPKPLEKKKTESGAKDQKTAQPAATPKPEKK